MKAILSYTFVSYISEEQEHFAYAEKHLKEQIGKTSTFSFPSSLISFLDLDIDSIAPLFKKVSDVLWSLTTTRDEKYADEAISILEGLSARHIYFQFLLLDWKLRIGHAIIYGDYTENLLQRSALLQMANTLRRMQQQISEVFAHVLDIDSGDEPSLKRMAVYYAEEGDHFTFSALPLRFDLIAPETFAEVLVPESVYHLIDYALRECVKREVRIRRCKNCGRWFAITGRSSAEYCDRPYDERGRTCREVGAVKVWAKNKKGDMVFAAYRKEYKKRHARIRAGKLDPEELYAWGTMAREKMKEVDGEKFTLGDFETWLKGS